MIKYEKVEDMTVGQVVDAMLAGEKFYYCSGSGPEYCELTINHFCPNFGAEGVYRKIEAPWWEKHVGRIVMVRGSSSENWAVDVFIEYNSEWECQFECNANRWIQMRPLTQAEKDAIITEG